MFVQNNDSAGGYLVLAALFLVTIIILLCLAPWATNGNYLWIQQSVASLLILAMVALLLCQNSTLRQSHRRELNKTRQDRQCQVLFTLIDAYHDEIMQQATCDFWRCYRAWRGNAKAAIAPLPERRRYYRKLLSFWSKVALSESLNYVMNPALFALFPDFTIIEKYLTAYARLAGCLQLVVSEELQRLATANADYLEKQLGHCLQNLEFLREINVETPPQLLLLYQKAAPDPATLHKIREVGAEFKGKDRERLVFIKIKGFIDEYDVSAYLEDAKNMEASQNRVVTRTLAGLAIDDYARRLAAQKRLPIFICHEDKFVKAEEPSPETLAAFTAMENVSWPVSSQPKSEPATPKAAVAAIDEKFPLAQLLLRDMAGQRLEMSEVYELHKNSCGSAFPKRDYKEALIRLEQEKKIATEPPADQRIKRGGKVTFADTVIVTFPPISGD